MSVEAGSTCISPRYILIPEDLFGTLTRTPTNINLTLQNSKHGTPRTAGAYPTPRTSSSLRPITSHSWRQRLNRVKDYRVVGIHAGAHFKTDVPCPEEDIFDDAEYSGMEGGSNDEDSEDIINLVAQANVSKLDTVNILPRIKSSPCQMHSKLSRRQQDLLYTTNHHGGRVQGQDQPRPHRDSRQKESNRRSPEARHQSPIQTHQNHPVTYRRPTLPKDCQTEDYVASWLIHGSKPEGDNHFPEIVKDGHKSKTSQKHQQQRRVRNSLLSE